MKNSNRTLLFISILIVAVIASFIVINRGNHPIQKLDLIIVSLIVLIGIFGLVQAVRKSNEEKKGYPAEDELSTRIKHQSGYYAYLISMYMWLFIFLFKDKFPDTESMLGSGILLSALAGFVVKFWIKRRLNEKSN